MKKILIVLMVLCAVGLMGGLYRTLAQLDNLGQEKTGTPCMEQLLPAMPDVGLDSASMIPLY